jgi:hypothetical protein
VSLHLSTIKRLTVYHKPLMIHGFHHCCRGGCSLGNVWLACAIAVASAGEIELDDERRTVGPGDAILIPPGAWHSIMATEPLRFLCCCAPPYAHEDTYFE